jgi:hypothetical protein
LRQSKQCSRGSQLIRIYGGLAAPGYRTHIQLMEALVDFGRLPGKPLNQFLLLPRIAFDGVKQLMRPASGLAQ